MRGIFEDRCPLLIDGANMIQENQDGWCQQLIIEHRVVHPVELKYCVSSAIDISIFVGIFKKIMITTIVSHGPKYIALFALCTHSSSNTNQALVSSFFC